MRGKKPGGSGSSSRRCSGVGTDGQEVSVYVQSTYCNDMANVCSPGPRGLLPGRAWRYECSKKQKERLLVEGGIGTRTNVGLECRSELDLCANGQSARLEGKNRWF